MKFLAAAWEQIYGLLVEDGQIAIGTLLAFIATAAYAYLSNEDVRDSAGWVLLVLLMSLLVVNLYSTGRKAFDARTGH